MGGTLNILVNKVQFWGGGGDGMESRSRTIMFAHLP